MDPSIQPEPPMHVLIASANPLFGKGLERQLLQRWKNPTPQIRLIENMVDTLKTLQEWSPDLVIVDYDDQEINRAEFLNRFVSGDRPMQVILLSLLEGGEVVVYNRRILNYTQMDDWIKQPWMENSPKVQQPTRPKRSGNMKHFAIAGVLVIVLTILTYLVLNAIGLMPVQASSQAVTIDQLFDVELMIISFLFSLIMVFLGYSIVVFRRKAGSEEEGKHVTGSTPLEITWTIIPLMTVLYISYLGSQNLADILRKDPQAMEVKVTAGQWYWSFEYPAYGLTSQVLNVPVNQQIHLSMTSKDVIHSFWVPEFRVKQDVLPGANLVKELRFTPIKLGQYPVLCNQLCGGAHAYMTSKVNVMTKQDFQNWVNSEMAAATADPSARGQKISQTSGCLGCHSIDGKSGVGPTWAKLSGAPVQLADGSSVTADEAYLKSSILDPNAQIVKGFPPNVMSSTYKTQFNDQQLNDIIAYIETLK